jgi:putative transposase
MARSPRITIPAYPHHIIQRGNNRAATFFADDDYCFFLECLRRAKIKCRCRIYAYVLMTNHFHLLVEPAEIGDLGRFMQSVGRRYVRYINETYGRSGTLWEGRFKSAAVSRDQYLIACSRYIELNPLRAGIVEHPSIIVGVVTSAADWACRMVCWMTIRGTQVWERLNKRDKKNIDGG